MTAVADRSSKAGHHPAARLLWARPAALDDSRIVRSGSGLPAVLREAGGQRLEPGRETLGEGRRRGPPYAAAKIGACSGSAPPTTDGRCFRASHPSSPGQSGSQSSQRVLTRSRRPSPRPQCSSSTQTTRPSSPTSASPSRVSHLMKRRQGFWRAKINCQSGRNVGARPSARPARPCAGGKLAHVGPCRLRLRDHGRPCSSGARSVSRPDF